MAGRRLAMRLEQRIVACGAVRHGRGYVSEKALERRGVMRFAQLQAALSQQRPWR